ncbi:MAG: hypothetical protein EA344_07960 [Alkalicoccus sp.]|nr:MAG: hypothetical protein EA344_07960 [Alkalicoccus sp.]
MRYILLAALLLTACSDDGSLPSDRNSSEAEEEEMAAVTNAGSVSAEELHEALRERHGAEVLRQLIKHKIFEAEAENLGITEEDVEKEMLFLRETLGLQETDDFYSLAEIQGLSSQEQLQERILKRLVLEELTGNDRGFEEADLVQEYESGEAVNVRHILVENREKAQEISSRLEEEDFSELAETYSLDPGSSSSGGDLGLIRRGTRSPPFEEAAFTLKEGEISEPVESPFGFHIIEVTGREPFNEPFDEVSEQLYTSVNERHMYQMQRKEEELIEEAEISILDEDFEDLFE